MLLSGRLYSENYNATKPKSHSGEATILYREGLKIVTSSARERERVQWREKLVVVPLREISNVSNTEKGGGWKSLISCEENVVDARVLLSDAPQVAPIVTASC